MRNVRAVAALTLEQVIENGKSLTDVLSSAVKQFSDARDQAFLQALCFGVCRWYFRLDAVAQQFLDKPLKAKDQDVYMLILLGLYQLTEMRVPEYAAVTETVDAAKSLKKIWAKNLINGVLRQFQRHSEEVKLSEEESLSHPDWITDKVKQAYPENWEAILTANNQQPPFALRVNQQKISREKYLEKLKSKGIEAEIIPHTAAGIILKKPLNVVELPGFARGEVSVQDGAAQLAAELMELKPRLKVLDACAAPGGKTAHMLEIEPSIACIAVDNDADRLERIKENLSRLELKATCITADAGDTNAWWDGELFDHILLDAPCSASGVIRRHPDIKLLRHESDLTPLAETQLRLLSALWALVKPGGMLLYATCSIFPDENALILERFLKEHSDAKEDQINADWIKNCTKGSQILPGMHNMDGFYYARLRK